MASASSGRGSKLRPSKRQGEGGKRRGQRERERKERMERGAHF